MTAALKAEKPFTAGGTLTPRPPYSFARSLRFMQTFTPCAGEQQVGDGFFAKAIRLDGQTVVFRVEGGDQALRYALFSDARISPALAAKVERVISDHLSLDDDLTGFYAQAEADPKFRPRVEALHGLHQVRFLTPIEAGIWAILGQRSPIAVARKAKRALVERWGHALEVDGHVHWAFPEAGELAGVRGEALAEVLKNERKTRYVLALIRAFQKLDAAFLREADYAEADAWLKEIDGVGDWTSAFVLFRCIGRTDHCPMTGPTADAARAVYGRSLSEAQAKALLEGYEPHSGYWSLYLRATV